MLVTLAKFEQLKSTSLHALVAKIAKVLDADMEKDQATLLEVVSNMDDVVFHDYVKRRSVAIVQIIQDGILRSGVDWLNAPKPSGAPIHQLTFAQS